MSMLLTNTSCQPKRLLVESNGQANWVADLPKASAGEMADDALESPRKLRLLYISPQFPSLSAVFEQNEWLGLKASGVHISMLSCRRASEQERESCHAFCRHLMGEVRYASLGSVTSGLCWCLRNRPWPTLKCSRLAIQAAAAHHARARQHLGALLLAVAFAPFGSASGSTTIHADFVQGTATVAWYLSGLLGIPFTMKAHAFDIYSGRAGERELTRFFRRKAAAASAIFVAHDYGRRRLTREFPELVPKLLVHRVSVRICDSEPLPFPAITEAPLVVALGRLEKKKGFDQLVLAISLLRDTSDIRCEIHGAGAQAGALARLIRSQRLENRVRLHGVYRQEQLREILAPASAVIVPSIADPDGDMDGVPTVIYEAMAFARPVIASSISGITEAVQHGRTGLLVESKRPDRLAEAIRDLLSVPERARRAGLAGRAFVEEHHDHLKQSLRLARLLSKASATAALKPD